MQINGHLLCHIKNPTLPNRSVEMVQSIYILKIIPQNFWDSQNVIRDKIHHIISSSRQSVLSRKYPPDKRATRWYISPGVKWQFVHDQGCIVTCHETVAMQSFRVRKLSSARHTFSTPDLRDSPIQRNHRPDYIGWDHGFFENSNLIKNHYCNLPSLLWYGIKLIL